MSGRLRDRVEAEANRLLRERVARTRQALEASLADLGQPLDLALTPGEWGAAGGTAHLQALRDAVDAIARGGGQRDILAALLDAAGAFYPRAALFVLKGNTLTGWAGLGFLEEGGFGSDDLQRIGLPGAGAHLLAQALQRRAAVRSGPEGPGTEIVRALGGVRPGEATAVPLLVRGRPVGVLYGDTGSSREGGQPLALEIAARYAGLAMECLASARRGADQDLSPGPADPREPAGRAAARRAGAPAAPEEAEVQALLVDLEGHPRRPSGDDGLSDEERRRHTDARRFAHLLVSELLLYNEEAVIQGRKHRDLYKRLRKEIDRSRQAYDSRVASQLRTGTNYFDEELVRVLAQGDPALLGS
jgi:hypothetical protein